MIMIDLYQEEPALPKGQQNRLDATKLPDQFRATLPYLTKPAVTMPRPTGGTTPPASTSSPTNPTPGGSAAVRKGNAKATLGARK